MRRHSATINRVGVLIEWGQEKKPNPLGRKDQRRIRCNFVIVGRLLELKLQLEIGEFKLEVQLDTSAAAAGLAAISPIIGLDAQLHFELESTS